VNPKESTGMANPKLIKRKRPGHLYEYYSFDDGELRFDTLITTDFNKHSSLPTIVDSPVAVIPYNEYYSSQELSIDSPSLDGLDEFFQANLATGVLINLNTTRNVVDVSI
jgi:hypothetical protein